MENNMTLEEIIQQLRKQNSELAQRLQIWRMENAKLEDDKLQQLRKQNSELAQRLQFWRMENAKLEDDKLQMVKENNILTYENNRYKEQLLKFKHNESIIKLSLKRSLTDIVNGSEHIRSLFEVFNDQEIDFTEKTSPKRITNQSSVLANNVNHVHPMIRGITIKKPIIRISRAVLEPIEPLASVVSENNTSSEHEAENDNSPPQNVSMPTQQVEMLDLCVSLCRVDSPDRRTRTPKKTFPTSPDLSNTTNNRPCSPLRDQAATAMEIEQAVTEDHGGEGNRVYVDENGKNCNFLPEGSFQYRSRLECVVEESEHDSLKWTNSPKPNPFVALSRTLEEDFSKSSSENKTQSPMAGEDPLEGPSWRFENITTRRNEFVSIRKKKKISFHENSANDKTEDAQLPDSTTNGSIKGTSTDQSLFDKTFPSPDFQSTPVLNCLSNVNKKPEQLSENNESITLPSPKEPPEEKKLDSTKNLLHAKVVLSKMKKETAKKTAPRRKQMKTRKASAVDLNLESEMEHTPPKKISESQPTNTPSSRGSTLLFRSSSECSNESLTSRPRRGETKDYKEKPLNKKLRRN